MKEFEARKDLYYAIVVQGDLWQRKELNSLSMVVLKKVENQEFAAKDAAKMDVTFEKVGVLQIESMALWSC